MNRNNSVFIAFIITTYLLLAACGGLSSKQQASADDAMKALRKLGAATQVGVNYQQYGSLVIDAQAEVNGALAVLPDGELKKEMNAAMEAYADASQVWSKKIAERGIYQDEEPGKTVIPKYSLKTEKTFPGELIKTDPDDALQAIWAAARLHLDKASSLFQK